MPADLRRALGRTLAADDSVLRAIAESDFDNHTAAVELGNILRPTVAVAWMGSFAVLALARGPEWQSTLASEDAASLRWSFAQEVRRTSPFVPALAGIVRVHIFSRGDLHLQRGERVVLDVAESTTTGPFTPNRRCPDRTVMSIMGWSSTSMAARYQHVTDPMRREVADRVGGLLFGGAGLGCGG